MSGGLSIYGLKDSSKLFDVSAVTAVVDPERLGRAWLACPTETSD